MEARPGERGSTTKLRIKGHKRWDEDSSDGGPDTRQTKGGRRGGLGRLSVGAGRGRGRRRDEHGMGMPQLLKICF